MPTDGAIIRGELFDRFSAELETLSPAYKGMYACPLCLKLFDRSSVDLQPGASHTELTLEHVVPNRLGITRYVLTCQKCNNDVGGASIDSSLHKHVNFGEFIRRVDGASWNATVEFEGHLIPCKWTRTDKGHELKVVGKASSPAAQKAFEEMLRGKPESFHLHFPMPSERHAQVSQLKSGYLACFRVIGYPYVGLPLATSIREQICNPAKCILPLDALVVSIANSEARNGLAISKADHAAIATVFALKRAIHGSQLRAVLLPSPDSPPHFFEIMNQLKESGQSAFKGDFVYL